MTEGTACRLSPLPGFSELIAFGEYRHYRLGDDVVSIEGLIIRQILRVSKKNIVLNLPNM